VLFLSCELLMTDLFTLLLLLLPTLVLAFQPWGVVQPVGSSRRTGLHRLRSYADEDPDGTMQLVHLQCPVGLSPQLLGDAMLDAGAFFVTVRDSNEGTDAEQPIFAVYRPGATSEVVLDTKGEGVTQLWSNSTLEVGFKASTDIEKTLLDAAATSGLSALPRFRISTISQHDWVTKVQSTWPPVVLPGCLVIKFPWHEAADVAAATAQKAADAGDGSSGEDDEVVLTLNPGMAFGTGEHDTTQMCCTALRRLLASTSSISAAFSGSDLTVLDYGSGSGVLSFAAVRFGAERAVGVEIDPDALAVSLKNAKLNGLEDAFAAHSPGIEAASPKQYPIVISNIFATTIIELRDVLVSRVAPGGSLVLSGIWGREQATWVQDAFADSGMGTFDVTYSSSGWALMEATRIT